jgi:hypothetical protein
MKKIEVLVGNCLVGDALWCWEHFKPEADVEKTAVCIGYNRPAVEVLRDVVGLQIDQIVERTAPPRALIPFGGIADYTSWCKEYAPPVDGLEQRRFRANHDLTPFWFKRPPLGCDCPSLWAHLRRNTYESERYMTMQLDSVHNWKRVDEMRKVNYPLRIKSIALSREQHFHESELIQDRPLPEIANHLLAADFHVGINSSITVLAMLLGVPTVLCNFGVVGDWENIPDYVRILSTPKAADIERAIDEVRP